MSGARDRALVVVCDWHGTEAPANLLGPRERAHVSDLDDARRREWTRARLTAKAALAWLDGYKYEDVEILPDRDGAPLLSVRGTSRVAVSLAHTGDVMAGAAALGGAPIGVDVERIDPRNDILLGRLLCRSESSPFRDDRPGAASTLLFACKESALKACRGRSPAPRDYHVHLAADGLRVRGPHARELRAWTAVMDEVAAVFCWDRPEPPQWRRVPPAQLVAALAA